MGLTASASLRNRIFCFFFFLSVGERCTAYCRDGCICLVYFLAHDD